MSLSKYQMWMTIMKWTIFAIFATVYVQGTTITKSKFTRISVSKATLLRSETKETLPAFNKFSCLANAISHDWSYLACFDTVCSLYDIDLPSDHEVEEGTTGIIDNCYTKAKVCIFNGESYEVGEYRPAANCGFDAICTTDGWLSDDCPANYTFIPGNGCLSLIEIEYYYNPSQDYCRDRGARLVISWNFEALRQYMKCAHPEVPFTRVGAVNGKWSDGRNVSATEWDEGEPTHLDEVTICIYLKPLEFRLNTGRCPKATFFLCQHKTLGLM